MLERPSARLLVIDPRGRVLLFLFEHKEGPLDGKRFWATPGGALDAGETFSEAACRELEEETGIALADPGPEIAQRLATFQLSDGQAVYADERYFLIRVEHATISSKGWTELERQVMAKHKWWSADELSASDEVFFPEDLHDILRETGIW